MQTYSTTQSPVGRRHQTPVVVVPFSHGPHYAFEAMTLAVALASTVPALSSNVEVIFVPMRPSFSLLQFFRWQATKRRMKRSDVWKRIGLVNGRLRLESDSVDALNAFFQTSDETRAIARFPTDSRPLLDGHTDLSAPYQRIAQGEPTLIQFEGWSILARTVAPDFAQRAKDTLTSSTFTLLLFLRSLSFWFGESGRSRWKKQVLATRFHGIHIGDLICSSALSHKSGHAGQLTPMLRIFSYASTAARLVLHCERIGQLSPTFSTAPELAYIQWVIPRSLAKFGTKPIAVRESAVFQTVDPDLRPNEGAFPWYRPSLVASASDQVRSDPTEIAAWMDKRTRARSAITVTGATYSTELSSSARRQLELLSKERFERAHVIFLHDFRDAQFIYGIDELVDLYSWTEFSIQQSTSIEGCLTIVKEHPASIVEQNSINVRALRRLQMKFRHDGVYFLDGTVLLSDLLKCLGRSNFVGITHHGSVAEELVWNDTAVIASSVGIWGEELAFCPIWRTKFEYEVLLKAAPAVLRSWASVESLQRYLAARRSLRPPLRASAVASETLNLPEHNLSSGARFALIQDYLANAPDSAAAAMVERLLPDLRLARSFLE